MARSGRNTSLVQHGLGCSCTYYDYQFSKARLSLVTVNVKTTVFVRGNLPGFQW